MALNDILVHVDSTRACAARVDAAIELACSHGAHLTGLYILPEFTIPLYVTSPMASEILQAQRDVAQARVREAENAFRTATSRAGLNAEWRAEEGELISVLNLHTHYVDLVIVGQVDTQDPEWTDTNLPDKVVLEAGRPVLIIPYVGVFQPIGKRVMVAWSAARESVRAVNDALPLLEKSKKVEVLAINPSSADTEHGDIPCADICLHLARHGVNAEAHSMQAEDIKAGDLLLSRAADEGVDLIVMGAYGHSRFRQIILSGVTRHLLKYMTVPVLMSH